MTRYIANSFSLQMVKSMGLGTLAFCELSEKMFKTLSENAYSVIGHEDLATLLGVKYNRESIELKSGDILYVAQLSGGRLPEGCKELPEDVHLKYYQLVITGDESNG